MLLQADDKVKLCYYVEGMRPDGARVTQAGFESKEDAAEWMSAHAPQSRGFAVWVLRDQAIYDSYDSDAVQVKNIQ